MSSTRRSLRRRSCTGARQEGQAARGERKTDAAGLEGMNRRRFSTASRRVPRAEAAAKNHPPAPAGRARRAHAQRRLGRAEWAAKRPKAGRGAGDGCAPGWAAPSRTAQGEGEEGGWAAPSQPTTRGKRGGREGQTGPRAGETARDKEEEGSLFILFPILAIIHH